MIDARRKTKYQESWRRIIFVLVEYVQRLFKDRTLDDTGLQHSKPHSRFHVTPIVDYNKLGESRRDIPPILISSFAPVTAGTTTILREIPGLLFANAKAVNNYPL